MMHCIFFNPISSTLPTGSVFYIISHYLLSATNTILAKLVKTYILCKYL